MAESYQELQAKMKAIETEAEELRKKLEKAKEDELARLTNEENAKIEAIPQTVKDWLLANVPHIRGTCSRGSTENGFYTRRDENGKEYVTHDCPRCAMEEMFNGYNPGFELVVDVSVHKIDI